MCMYLVGCCSDPEEEPIASSVFQMRNRCGRSYGSLYVEVLGLNQCLNLGPVYFLMQPWRIMVFAKIQFIAIGRRPWWLSLVFYKPDMHCVHSMHSSSQVQGWAQKLGVAHGEDRGKADWGI